MAPEDKRIVEEQERGASRKVEERVGASRSDEQRDRLLCDLQLLQRHRLRADSVGGDGHAIFDERNQPRDENRHPGLCARQTAQVAVPGVEHYEVRHAEKPHGHPIDV